jgi:hypothetical protein
MGLAEEITAAREAALAFAEDGEALAGVVPTEPGLGARVYLCAYENGDGRRWLALDADGRPVSDRTLLRDAVSIAAMCELAEESAGGGDVNELRARLAELRRVENPEGIGDAEQAAEELAVALQEEPRIASPGYLDEIGLAAARLEQALGGHGSPFAEAMASGVGAAEALADSVERSYKTTLNKEM